MNRAWWSCAVWKRFKATTIVVNNNRRWVQCPHCKMRDICSWSWQFHKPWSSNCILRRTPYLQRCEKWAKISAILLLTSQAFLQKAFNHQRHLWLEQLLMVPQTDLYWRIFTSVIRRLYQATPGTDHSAFAHQFDERKKRSIYFLQPQIIRNAFKFVFFY